MDFDVINTTTKDELLTAIEDHQDTNFRIGAGYTDLIMNLRFQPTEGMTLINIAQMKDPSFISIEEQQDHIVLGTLVTASNIVNSPLIKLEFPVLHEAALSVASTQIRNSATVGGNICNASPSADMAGALVALKAVCCVLNSKGEERIEPLASFIVGVGKTSLDKNEVLKSISIPRNSGDQLKSGFEKVGTRNSMEISIVSLAYHFQLDESGKVVDAGVSCGAVAPTIPFAESACDFMVGKDLDGLSETDKEEFAENVLKYATPISDIRASEWYRKEVLFNISQAIFD
ncbi:MAG: hypothetical protein GY816_00085 [Cytophagales bacterium]|nr:hypothetical protein [Cytophagales bacterium]